MKDRAPALELPKRLNALASFVPSHCEVVADIGYDHGHLITRLLHDRPSLRLIGIERQTGSKEIFWRNATGPGIVDRVSLLEGDGFAPLGDHAVDCAVIAGMGESSIVTILEQARKRPPWVVLCPPGPAALLRPALARLGYRVADEGLAFDNGRFYEVMAFARDDGPTLSALDLLFGPALPSVPGFDAYLAHLESSRRHWRVDELEPLIRSSWPAATADNAGAFQRLKAAAIPKLRRKLRW